jgi:hypothetical protein
MPDFYRSLCIPCFDHLTPSVDASSDHCTNLLDLHQDFYSTNKSPATWGPQNPRMFAPTIDSLPPLAQAKTGPIPC